MTLNDFQTKVKVMHHFRYQSIPHIRLPMAVNSNFLTHRLATIHTSQTDNRQVDETDDRLTQHCNVIVTVRLYGELKRLVTN